MRFLVIGRSITAEVTSNKIVVSEIDTPVVFGTKKAAVDFCHTQYTNQSEHEHCQDLLTELSEYGFWANDQVEYMLFEIPDSSEDGDYLEIPAG